MTAWTPRSRQASMPRAAVPILAVALQAAAGSALAADTPPVQGRFLMTPVDGGFLRMDTDTGAVSLCAKKASDWRCETLPDDYQTLQKENEALKKQLAEARKDGGVPSGSADRKRNWPTDEEIDKGFDKLDKYLRKFKELIEKYQGGEPPGKT